MLATDQIETLIQQLTPTEKAELCSGSDMWHSKAIERLDIPSIMLTDGPHGLRKQAGDGDHAGLLTSVTATCFPPAASLAATWNLDLVEKVGIALGRECLAESVSVLLGPGVNIKRHPLGGRNFEYFSEDPFLSGKMAAAWIQGVQSQQVGASIKHFAVNNHENARMVVDAIVDERALREIYLPAFEIAVKETQPWTVMCAYNKLNGVYLSDNKYLLTDILRDEFGYEGLVVSDWGAVNDRVESIKAGMDLEMPFSFGYSQAKILAALDSGELTMQELDVVVKRILNLIDKGTPSAEQPTEVSLEDHHQLAREAAAQACVLLKNQDQLLPLATDQHIAVIGSLASDCRYQGSGSSQINPYKLEQPLDELKVVFGDDNVTYAPGYHADQPLSQSDIDEAITACQNSQAVVLVAGLPPSYESEGFDRSHMRIPQAQLELIEALREFHHKLIIVLQNGAPVELPFADSVGAILECYLGGQAGASAMAQVLAGMINPGGKLAETFPLSMDQVASDPWFNHNLRQTQYRESIWVGYRYFDTAEVAVRFPFGHGLSYTSFEYSELALSRNGDRGSADLTVSFMLTNTGDLAGDEVAQCYVGQSNPGVPRPKRELKAFDRVHLAPGESKRISLTLKERDFAYWSVAQHAWVVDNDTFTIYIGASIADIRLDQSISLDDYAQQPDRVAEHEAYFEPSPERFTASAFAQLLGREIPEPVAVRPFHSNSLLSEIEETKVGNALVERIMQAANEKFTSEEQMDELSQHLLTELLKGMPLRNLPMLSEGKISPSTLFRLIHLTNGSYLKALLGSHVDGR